MTLSVLKSSTVLPNSLDACLKIAVSLSGHNGLLCMLTPLYLSSPPNMFDSAISSAVKTMSIMANTNRCGVCSTMAFSKLNLLTQMGLSSDPMFTDDEEKIWDRTSTGFGARCVSPEP